MTLPPALSALCAAAGILPRYTGLDKIARDTSPATARALLAAMGLAAATEAEAAATAARLDAGRAARALPEWLVLEAGAPPHLVGTGDWTLTLESGEIHRGLAAGTLDLPPLPVGIHALVLAGAETALLSAPVRLPAPPRCWGLTLPLYGLRPAARGGLGDYADLRAAVTSAGALGAAFVGINPVHAGFAGDPGAFSPYSPSSRRWFNPVHIACAEGASPPGAALVDWAPAVATRMACLRGAFAALPPAARAIFDTWRAEQGAPLEAFAIHQALSDRFGPFWPDWPAAYRAPTSPEVAAFAAADPEAAAFHAWLQHGAQAQLGAVAEAGRDAGMALGLYLDLAVGTHPAGAETWADPALFARGVSLGAPPDAFAPQGQSWGLAPMIPTALSARGFRPLAQILRAQLRFAGLLRIDHILGFERAFWVPDSDLPGAYVVMPKAAMLAVARIEAARAGASIVGEDLGVIPEGLQADLAASGLLGCRLAMFDETPQDWPEGVLGSFGTHDLPPHEGWRRGEDIDWHERLGHAAPAAAAEMRARRARDVAGLAQRAGADGVDAMHALLGATPARVVALQIEDVFGAVDQANLPGTVHEHPNWRRRIAVAPEALAQAEPLRRAARVMAQAGRAGPACGP
jgi:4-alpha-glucanotransferase